MRKLHRYNEECVNSGGSVIVQVVIIIHLVFYLVFILFYFFYLGVEYFVPISVFGNPSFNLSYNSYMTAIVAVIEYGPIFGAI
jgi:hypothetical protein